MSAAPTTLDETTSGRRGSWSLAPADGAYSNVVAWSTGAAWYDALMDALATREGEERRRAVKVSPGTLLRVARAEWLSADVATGRGISTAHETLAAELGMCKRTVQRCRELIEVLGFSVTVEAGRYLTAAERKAARQAHGGRQYRAASLRALTLPKPQPVENVHLPSPREGQSVTPVLKSSPKRASARKTPATRPNHRRSCPANHGPRPLVDQKLSGELVTRLPWLAHGRHVGIVSQLLERVGISGTDWTAQGLLDAISRFCADSGARMVDPGTHRDPVAYFAWLVKAAQTTGAEPNRRRQERQAAERAAERAAQAERARQEAERVAAIDWAAVEAIQAQMRRDFPKKIKPARRLGSSPVR